MVFSVVDTGWPFGSSTETTSCTNMLSNVAELLRSKSGPPVAVCSGILMVTKRSVGSIVGLDAHMATDGPHACDKRAANCAETGCSHDCTQEAVPSEDP